MVRNGCAKEVYMGCCKHNNSKKEKKISIAEQSRNIKQYIMGFLFLVFLVGGWFYSLVGYFIPLCMVAGISIATVKGRKWCDWACPRGAFADKYLKIISRNGHIPDFLRSWPLRIGVLSFLMLMLTYRISSLWPDPYAIGRFFMILLTVTTTVGVVLAFLYHQRSWCYMCPIGTMSNWVGKNRKQLSMQQDGCIDCKACEKTCPMKLAPQELKTKSEMSFKGDCLKCGLCVDACPKKVLELP